MVVQACLRSSLRSRHWVKPKSSLPNTFLQFLWIFIFWGFSEIFLRYFWDFLDFSGTLVESRKKLSRKFPRNFPRKMGSIPTFEISTSKNSRSFEIVNFKKSVPTAHFLKCKPSASSHQ